ncbi:MAG: SDR family oxidoreductase [Candidatus Sericytochromatia bacterium]|nr:SDR family oxidoreductase [Candidatus Sericytochromatia bacterium]
MDFGIHDRVAMVAAGSKGLGKASALALVREGCRVSICARSSEALAVAQAELTEAGSGQPVLAVTADVTKLADLEHWVQQTKDRFGQIDILVTNTGGPPAAPFMALTDEQWQTGIDSTLLNVVRMCRLVIPEMQKQRWGRIIHITSFVAKQPEALLTISSTLRAGLSALTKTLATQVGPDGITVNAVLPGHALTDRQYHLAEIRMAQDGITEAAYFAGVAAEIPLRRLAAAQEIGDVVAFLASQAAAYVSGTSLAVDGGLSRATF